MELHIHHYHHTDDSFNLLNKGIHKIMATLQDIQAALAQAAIDATAEKAEVASAIQALTDQIAALQAQINSGSIVSQEDLDALLVSIQGIDQQVKDITVPVAPAP